MIFFFFDKSVNTPICLELKVPGFSKNKLCPLLIIFLASLKCVEEGVIRKIQSRLRLIKFSNDLPILTKLNFFFFYLT